MNGSVRGGKEEKKDDDKKVGGVSSLAPQASETTGTLVVEMVATCKDPRGQYEVLTLLYALRIGFYWALEW